MKATTPTVEAIIVTHDDPDAVRSCVQALVAQTITPKQIRIIDTAGHRPVPDDIRHLHQLVTVHRLETNTGPAGGWYEGIRLFRESDCSFAWLLDDDCLPAEHSLEQLLVDAQGADVIQSLMIDSRTGLEVSTQGWCSVLVGRNVVESVGLPDRDLVWWTEDTEYLQWRIPRAGFKVARSSLATVTITLRPPQATKPGWKYFYEARNQVSYRLKTQRPVHGAQVPRHLTARVRSWRALRSVARLGLRTIAVEQEKRLSKLLLVGRGAAAGIAGRTGMQIAIGEPDRASLALPRGGTEPRCEGSNPDRQSAG